VTLNQLGTKANYNVVQDSPQPSNLGSSSGHGENADGGDLPDAGRHKIRIIWDVDMEQVKMWFKDNQGNANVNPSLQDAGSAGSRGAGVAGFMDDDSA